jgi:hypothetical protein
MKNLFSFALALLLLVSLASCGGSKPEPAMKVEDGSFNLTPQEYIDYINNLIEAENDSRYLSIPDFTKSEKSIDVKGNNLYLTLTSDSDGKLTEIRCHWNAKKQGTTSNAGFYLSASILMISADEDAPEKVVGELDMLDTVSPMYDTSYTLDGALYSYSTYGHGQYNTITITPATDS